MSKRHRWARTRGRSNQWAITWACYNCFLRRRLKKAYQVVNCWEYLPAGVRDWRRARRTCGPCPRWKR